MKLIFGLTMGHRNGDWDTLVYFIRAKENSPDSYEGLKMAGSFSSFLPPLAYQKLKSALRRKHCIKLDSRTP